MSGLKSIVVAGGTGGLGSFVIKSLLALKSSTNPNISVYALSRTSDASSTPEKLGVDYDSEESILSVLKKVDADAVISTLGSPALMAAQHNLVKASAKAGVKLFVPSEYGLPTDLDHGKTNIYGFKAQTVDAAKEVGLPYLRVFTGLFSDIALNGPLLGLYLSPPKLVTLGPGDKPFSLTTREDIGSFLAYAITNVPLSTLQNKILRIEADRVTYNDLLTIAEEVFGKGKVEVVHQDVDLSETKKKLEEGGELGGNVLDFLKLRLSDGRGSVGDPVDNGLYPEWKPTSIKSIIANAVAKL